MVRVLRSVGLLRAHRGVGFFFGVLFIGALAPNSHASSCRDYYNNFAPSPHSQSAIRGSMSYQSTGWLSGRITIGNETYSVSRGLRGWNLEVPKDRVMSTPGSNTKIETIEIPVAVTQSGDMIGRTVEVNAAAPRRLQVSLGLDGNFYYSGNPAHISAKGDWVKIRLPKLETMSLANYLSLFGRERPTQEDVAAALAGELTWESIMPPSAARNLAVRNLLPEADALQRRGRWLGQDFERRPGESPALDMNQRLRRERDRRDGSGGLGSGERIIF